MIDWFGHLYPYTNVHELNLDWIIDRVKMEEESIKNFVGSSVIKYAVPIQWDITRQYERNTVVIDANSGDAYVSIAPVPVGFDLSHTEYWMKVFSLGNQLKILESQIAHNEGNSTRATISYTEGQLIFINDLLYITLTDIPVNTLFDAGNNIEQLTVEKFIDRVVTNIKNDIAAINNNIEAINNNIEAINNNIEAINNPFLIWIGDSFSEANRSNLVDYVCKHNGYEYINECQGGAGFAQTHYTNRTFDVQLQDALNNMTSKQKNRVRKIVIYGGLNDTWDVTESDLFAKIDNFYNIFLQNFDDSKVDVVYVPNFKAAGTFTSTTEANQAHVICRIIKYIQSKGVGSVVPTSIYWLTPFAKAIVFSSDLVHPSDAGYNIIKTFFDAVLGGTYGGVHVEVEDVECPNMPGAHVRCYFDDGVVNLRLEVTSTSDVTFNVNEYGMFNTGVYIPEMQLHNLDQNHYKNNEMIFAPFISRNQNVVYDPNFQMVLQSEMVYIRYVAATGAQSCQIAAQAVSQATYHA